MSITSISRDWGVGPAIVRITTTDSLVTAQGSSYLANQLTNIEDINSGPFEWKAGDNVLVQASDGSAMYQINSALNALVAAGTSPLLLKYATVAITAAEFLGMYAAPKLLIPAAGANQLLLLDRLELVMTYNSAAYAAGGVAAVQWDATASGAGVVASSTLAATVFQSTASTSWNMNAGVVPAAFATTVNKGLYLSNLTAAYTTGNSPMVAHVWYKVIPTA